MTPRLSVLLPVHDAVGTLAAALRSVRWQTFQDWEAVLVDDGSTDGSLELAHAAAREDPRLRVLPRPHQGLVPALQAGLAECRAPLVARMDADDLCRPDRFARQVECLDAHPQVAAVGSLVRVFPMATRTPGMARYEEWLNSLLSPEEIGRDLFVESPLVHPSVTFRRAAVEAVGGYRDSGGPEDYDLWLRMWERGARFAKVPEVLFFWRDHPGRVTRTDPRCHRDRFRDLKIETLFRGALSAGQEILVWGAGPNGKALCRDLAERGRPASAFVDSHPGRRGQRIAGLPVLGPDDLPPVGEATLLSTVGRPLARAEIRRHLEGLGWVEGRHFFCLA